MEKRDKENKEEEEKKKINEQSTPNLTERMLFFWGSTASSCKWAATAKILRVNKGFSALWLSTARGLRCCMSLSGATIRDISPSLSLPYSPAACIHRIGCTCCKWEGVNQYGRRDAEENCGSHVTLVSRWWRGHSSREACQMGGGGGAVANDPNAEQEKYGSPTDWDPEHCWWSCCLLNNIFRRSKMALSVKLNCVWNKQVAKILQTQCVICVTIFADHLGWWCRNIEINMTGLKNKKCLWKKETHLQSHVKWGLNIRSNLLTSLIIYKRKALMQETDPFITHIV